MKTSQAQRNSTDTSSCSHPKIKALHLVNSLTINVMRQVAKEDYAVATASACLLCAMAGTCNDTASERKYEAVDDSEQDMTLHEAMQYTLRLLEGKNDLIGNEVIWLQTLWTRKETKLSKKARSIFARYYCCEVKQLPVRKNKIYECKMKRRLQKLDPSGKFDDQFHAARFESISSSDVLLTSAVYISMQWREPFSTNQTTTCHFQVSDEKSIPVHMMTLRLGATYVNDDAIGATVTQLPLTAHDMSVLFYLPYEQTGMEFLETHLTEESCNNIIGEIARARPKPVNISIPKFSLLYNDSLALDFLDTGEHGNSCHFFHTMSTTVSELGINVPTQPDKHESTMLGPAVHDGIKWTTFRATRPFLFMLVDMRSKIIFISGKVTEPRWKKERKGNFSGKTVKRKTTYCCSCNV